MKHILSVLKRTHGFGGVLKYLLWPALLLLIWGATAYASSDRASKVNALKPLKGMCYVPYTSDWAAHNGPGQRYFDTDYTNSCFPLLWGTASKGRGDLKTLHGLGVNFLRLYDWSAPPSPPGGPLTLNLRNHLPFLDECAKYGIKVTIPFSNYNVYNINNPSFTWIKPNIEAMVEEAYQGGTTPHPAAAMLAVGNEILLHAAQNGLSYEQAVQYAIQVVEVILQKEDAMGIPEADKLLITLPLSTATFGHGSVGGAYGLTLINQYAAASSVCEAHHFLTDRYIISLNVEMDGPGTQTYLGQIKTRFPDTPVLFTEFGTGRDQIESELRAVIATEDPYAYFDETLMGVSIFTWVGEPGQTYTFPVAQIDGVGSYGTIQPSDYTPGGGEQYPVDNIQQFSVCDHIRNIYTGKGHTTVTCGSVFKVKLPAASGASSTEMSGLYADAAAEAFFSEPTVYMMDKSGTPYYARVLSSDYPTHELHCLWVEPVDPGTYSLFVEMDGPSRLVTEYFEVSGPMISEILSSRITETGRFEIRGRFFGQDPRVHLTYPDPVSGQLKTVPCTVLEGIDVELMDPVWEWLRNIVYAITDPLYPQIMDPVTGQSVLTAVVPQRFLKLLQDDAIQWPVPDSPAANASRTMNETDHPYSALAAPTVPAYSVGNRISTTHDAINPDSVLNASHVWFTDITATPNGNRYLFRGNEPLTDASTVDEQEIDFAGLYTILKQKYELQTGKTDFPTDIKLINVSLIGGRDSENDVLYREYASLGGRLKETSVFMRPGSFQPAETWYSVSGLNGFSIQGRLLWQPTGGLTTQPTEGTTQKQAETTLTALSSCPGIVMGGKTVYANPLTEIVTGIRNIMNNEGDAKGNPAYQGDVVIYVHCMHGHDRTSEVINSYLIGKKGEKAFSYQTLSDAVNEIHVPGASQIKFKYKTLKEPYGIAVEWYYIYQHGDGSYQPVPPGNQDPPGSY
ncbi:MAG: hypothetical protein K9M96_18600 [Deltaproteobacteria bacterium]|nr:hypothetical protein [Deltaproteobacteria bacterium]